MRWRDGAQERPSEGTRLQGLQLPAGAFPAPRRPLSGGAGSAAAPLRAGPSRPRAAGAQSAARRSGVGTQRESFLPTPAPRAAAHSSPGPGADPPPGPGPGPGRAGPGRAGSFALARAEQPPRPGPSGSQSGRGSRNGRRSPAASRPRHLGGSPSRCLRFPDPCPRAPACPGAEGRCWEPRAQRGRRRETPHPPRARPGRALPREGAAPAGPDTCSQARRHRRGPG